MSPTTPSPTPTHAPAPQPDMLHAALWYARRGLSIFPLKPGTKAPATAKGVYAATCDEAVIRAWWAENPAYGIGWHPGADGCLAVDLDSYKDKYAGGELLRDADLETVVTVTGSGGRHVWYRVPAGLVYGNRNRGLPAGIDIKSTGGYVVLPPSLHPNGTRYTFAPGHELGGAHPVAPLPAALGVLLDAAARGDADPIELPPDDGTCPDLARWDLPAPILAAIHTPTAKGGRSEIDFAICVALVRAGATDADIAQVFRHYPTSGKYAQRRGGGILAAENYLARTIGNARAAAAPSPADATLRADLERARLFLHSGGGAELLRAGGIRRIDDYRPTLDALLDVARARLTVRFVVSARMVGETCNKGHCTILRQWAKLEAAGVLRMVKDDNGTLLDLAPLCDAARRSIVSAPHYTLGTAPAAAGGGGADTELRPDAFPDSYYADHRADDAYTAYPVRYAQPRRPGVELLPSMTGACLTVAAYLSANPVSTVDAICAGTGMRAGGVRRALGRLDELGLLLTWAGRPRRYELHPNHEDRLDDIRPTLSGYGRALTIRMANAAARSAWYDREARRRVKRDRGELDKLLGRRDRYLTAAYDWRSQLEALGINPAVRVVRRQPKPKTLKIDPLVEWERMAPAWAAWRDLADLPRPERYRLLELAGYTRREIDDARRLAPRAGHAPRRFLGVGEPAAAC